MRMTEIRGETTRVPLASGVELQGYVAHPEGEGPHPAMLVIHEVYGLTAHVESLARRLAAAGYLAIAPDLYTNDEVRRGLTEDDIEDAISVRVAEDPEKVLTELGDRRAVVERAISWRADLRSRVDEFVDDLASVAEWTRARDDTSGSLGSIGWCMGGGVNGFLATRGIGLSGAVIFYGPPPPPEVAERVACAIQGHYGELDTAITSRVPDFVEAVQQAGQVSIDAHLYAGAPHGFVNEGTSRFRAEPTAVAWARTIEFLHRHVR